jgi:hypothetical protein
MFRGEPMNKTFARDMLSGCDGLLPLEPSALTKMLFELFVSHKKPADVLSVLVPNIRHRTFPFVKLVISANDTEPPLEMLTGIATTLLVTTKFQEPAMNRTCEPELPAGRLAETITLLAVKLPMFVQASFMSNIIALVTTTPLSVISWFVQT